MIRLPKGFTPVSLEKLLLVFSESSLGTLLWEHLGMSADEAKTKVQALEAKNLVMFAIAPGGAPSCFIAPSTADLNPYERPEDFALAEKLISFWDLQGKFDAANGELISPDNLVDSAAAVTVQTPEGPMSVTARVVARLYKLGLITKDNLGTLRASSKAELIKSTAEYGICDFCGADPAKNIEDVPDFEMPDGSSARGWTMSVSGWASCDVCHEMISRDRRDDLLRRSLKSTYHIGGKLTEFALKDLHKKFWQAWDKKHRMQVEGYGPQPHWVVALEKKAAAIRELKFIETLPPWHKLASHIKWTSLAEDYIALQQAEIYSFNAETMHAIVTGANSIPHESSLRSVELPTARSGWFWFAQPFQVMSSPVSETTAALLWSWDMKAEKPTIRFTAYVWDRQRETMIPATKWIWPMDISFHDMLGLSAQLHKKLYGPEGQFKGQQFLLGQDITLKAVAELSLFFMMSCLWFRQTVPGTKKKVEPKLTQEPGHIERHARKRYEREFNLTPKVRIIALRRTARTVAEPGEQHEGIRHLTVRFIVKGHARLQPCGPGRAERKLIWIDAFKKGPDDAPFKEQDQKVFAVVR